MVSKHVFGMDLEHRETAGVWIGGQFQRAGLFGNVRDEQSVAVATICRKLLAGEGQIGKGLRVVRSG